MAKGYLYDNGDELITREDVNEVPDSSSAHAGDVLGLDTNKKPKWSTPESELPSTGSASVGDVLTLDEDKEPVWSTPSEPLQMIDCTIDKDQNTGTWTVRFVKGENQYYTIGDLYNMYQDGILLHCVDVGTSSKLISFLSVPYMKLNESGTTAEVDLGYILIFDASNSKMLLLRAWNTGKALADDYYSIASNRTYSFDLTAST